MVEQPQGSGSRLIEFLLKSGKNPQLACAILYMLLGLPCTFIKVVDGQPTAEVSSLPVLLSSFISHFLQFPASLFMTFALAKLNCLWLFTATMLFFAYLWLQCLVPCFASQFDGYSFIFSSGFTPTRNFLLTLRAPIFPPLRNVIYISLLHYILIS